MKRSGCVNEDTRQLTFLKPPSNPNFINDIEDLGEPDNTWTVLLKRYGSVETTSGREIWKVQQARPEVQALIECNWDAQLQSLVTSRCAIQVNGQYYNILAAYNVDEANERFRCECRSSREP